MGAIQHCESSLLILDNAIRAGRPRDAKDSLMLNSEVVEQITSCYSGYYRTNQWIRDGSASSDDSGN